VRSKAKHLFKKPQQRQQQQQQQQQKGQEDALDWVQQKLLLLDLTKRRITARQALIEADAAMLQAMTPEMRAKWWEVRVS